MTHHTQANAYKTGGPTLNVRFLSGLKIVHEDISFHGNIFNIECIWFVYADFLQRKLVKVKNE